MQKRVFGVYFSIIRRKAICAVDVMESASSRMMSLYFVARELALPLVMIPSSEGLAKELKICFVELKVLICSLYTVVSSHFTVPC